MLYTKEASVTDPDAHQSEMQNPDPHQSEKGHFGALEDPNLQKVSDRIRICIKLKVRSHKQ
jgi:hypothetical protein